ncbi:MAG: hypothetical protein JKY56_18250 [Kofleriaceae bacterium]|nr:hypothetical protein [Kofleriaceae bacterium]
MALVRCPKCNTFVKPASFNTGLCPFCSSARVASLRNPIPGVVLATAIAASSACSADKTRTDTKPSTTINNDNGQGAANETPHSQDAGPDNAGPDNATPDTEQSDKTPDTNDTTPSDSYIPAVPMPDVAIYGGPPDTGLDKPTPEPAPKPRPEPNAPIYGGPPG